VVADVVFEAEAEQFQHHFDEEELSENFVHLFEPLTFLIRHVDSVQSQYNYIHHDRYNNDQGEKWVGNHGV